MSEQVQPDNRSVVSPSSVVIGTSHDQFRSCRLLALSEDKNIKAWEIENNNDEVRIEEDPLTNKTGFRNT